MNASPARRRLPGPRISGFFGLSFMLHSTALAILLAASFRNPKPGFDFKVMQVKLYHPAQLAVGSAQAAEPGAPGSKAKPAAEPAAKKKEGKAVVPKDATRESIAKTGSTAKTSDVERRSVQQAIAELAREVGASDRAGADAEWASLVAGINVDLERRAYNQRAGGVYNRNWSVPASVPQDRNLRVRVVVRIDREGKVIDYQVFSKSGHSEFDRSVMRLLDTVKELPAPPVTGGDWYSIGIEFTPLQEE